jgi:hypothetical protein
MYSVFDAFLNVETWHTHHALDEQRFFKALHQVVRDEHFSPEAMGDYMAQHLGVSRNEDHLGAEINAYVRKAWAVKDYLNATNS